MKKKPERWRILIRKRGGRESVRLERLQSITEEEAVEKMQSIARTALD